MKMNDIMVALVHLPERFNSSDISMYELLKQTGYFEAYDKISETTIHDTLIQYPECVDEWIGYSEDKRTSSGWYMKQINATHYKVGYFSSKSDRNVETMYFDCIDACAAFIKHELEDIRRT